MITVDRWGSVRIEHLRSFVVLAEELHFTRASARLQISQGGLSRRLTQLESSMGVTLLQRTTRKVSLTDAGRLLHAAAPGLLESLDAALCATAILKPLSERSGRDRRSDDAARLGIPIARW